MFACISSPSPTPQLAPSPPNKWSFWHNRNSFPCGLGSLFIRGGRHHYRVSVTWLNIESLPSFYHVDDDLGQGDQYRALNIWGVCISKYEISPKGSYIQLGSILLLMMTAMRLATVIILRNYNIAITLRYCNNIAELCRGHFSCRQLCVQLARFQISQNCNFR